MSPSRPERLNAAKPRKVRLDQLIVERGLVPTRSRAQALLLAGAERELCLGGIVVVIAHVAVEPLDRFDTDVRNLGFQRDNG